MADEVAMNEEQELEALLGYLNQDAGNQGMGEPMLPQHETSALWSNSASQDQLQPDTPYGSDDDEYDNIFMDVIQEEERLSSQQQPPGPTEDQDMMDMS